MTVDLTTHTKPSARHHHGRNHKHHTTSEGAERHAPTQDSDQQISAPQDEVDEATASHPRTGPRDSTGIGNLSAAQGPQDCHDGPSPDSQRQTIYAGNQNTEDLNDMQILDLPSSNPLISYQGRTYSCQWTSALGTDLLFAVPPRTIPQDDPSGRNTGLSAATSKGAHSGERVKSKVDLIAATPLRLVAIPSKVKLRPSAVPSAFSHRETLDRGSQIYSNTDNSSNNFNERQGNKEPETRPSFFERLRAIKVARDEKDVDALPIQSTASYIEAVPEDEIAQDKMRHTVGGLSGTPYAALDNNPNQCRENDVNRGRGTGPTNLENRDTEVSTTVHERTKT